MTLTPRQLDVLRLMWEGLCSKEIADRLGLTYNSVISYRRELIWRLSAANSVHACRIALQRGLLLVEPAQRVRE